MADIGASLADAVSTFIAVPFDAIIGQSYAQSVLSIVIGFIVFSALSLAIMIIHTKENN
jgi:DHA1 family bicyclomycin/chloramphenicol resistance-like MFS transporter